jgi:acyl-CoA synthetase (AMP-forming)/AMP-acid ligase II
VRQAAALTGCEQRLQPDRRPACRPSRSSAPNLTGPDLAGLDLADALRAACEAELPRPKVPTEFCLVPELPLGATGKVSRRRLRDMAMA